MIDPVTASIVTGIGGELLGGLFGSSSAKKQNKAAIAAQERQYAQSKEMMQNRHQWEVADLRAAGLNPILSAHSAPSMGSTSQAPVVGELDQVASSARSLGKMSLERKQAMALLEQTKIANGKLIAETNSAEAQAKNISAQERFTKIQTQLMQKYGGKEAMSRIVGNYAGAVGDVNPFRFNSSKSVSDVTSKSTSNVTSRSTSKSENHNYSYKGKN